MNVVFEAMMLICFGFSWPFAVYKTWKTKSCHAKSFAFMGLIFFGYICGIVSKICQPGDGIPNIIWLYVINGLMVFIDISLSIKYRNNKPVVAPE
jgi:hypothetical protein